MALILLAACLVSRVVELSHYLREPHAICLRDGELTHGSCHHEPTRRHSDNAAQALATAHDAHDEHGDPCTTWRFVRRETAQPSAPLRFVASRVATPELARPHSVPRAQSIAIYLLAPKQSPPRLRLA